MKMALFCQIRPLIIVKVQNLLINLCKKGVIAHMKVEVSKKFNQIEQVSLAGEIKLVPALTSQAQIGWRKPEIRVLC